VKPTSMTLSRAALDANSLKARHCKMKMRWVSAALASVVILCCLTAGNAAECPGNLNAIDTRRVISIEPTKHAHLVCMQKYQNPEVRRQSHGVARQAKARLSNLRVFSAGRPVPKGGGTYRVGNPYVIAGRTYTPQKDPSYRVEGKASWYGEDFHGRRTANGEIFDMHAISAAHPTLPLPSYVRVTNLENNRSLVVRLNDRGPYHGHRLIDVSVRAAKLLGFYDQGLAQARVEYLGRAELEGSDDNTLAATLQYENLIAVQVAANAPVQPDTSNPSLVDRELMQTQCVRRHSTTMNPQQVSFNGNWVENVNCKFATSETKLAFSGLSTLKRNSYCVADYAQIDAVSF